MDRVLGRSIALSGKSLAAKIGACWVSSAVEGDVDAAIDILKIWMDAKVEGEPVVVLVRGGLPEPDDLD